MITKEQKQEIITKFGGDEKNTGSTKVQIALMTARINDLQTHFKNNPKDTNGKRGLLTLVGQRRSLLKYLARTDLEGYRQLIADLSLRK
ncbi:MAG: 30S ribosomal protein S15 [Sphaerochaeta sp.]|jgi:small subunit ribosomal protein S15|nr:30S ribosomal protein S15 [Sphaerochaeta sp.]MCH3920709.1 30S ribosomal protein S15 [Sphaerochaeta sp.]MCI2045852.1 30S ribosomal protein S15 [Sphaerochaeta sp.]MCI2076573.1 30S ribosomal protein S15 [Sphaerochaeta sp.]MCI2096474.1 30S ribosomal protein S15 [Sphaerochaeta sp.]